MNNNSERSVTIREKTLKAIRINIAILILAIGILLIFQYKSKANEMSEKASSIASQMDNFFQIGELYISNYAHPDLINLPIEQQYEQFQKDLLPFPFFNQLSLFSSNGQLITGFPNDTEPSISDELVLFLNKKQTNSTLLITIKENSLPLDRVFAFIKTITIPENNYLVYLMAETDWSSNPINLHLLDLIQELNQSGMSVSILDDNGLLIMSLGSLTETSPNFNTDMLISSSPLRLNDWTIEISMPYTAFWMDAFKNLFPYLLVLAILGALLSYAFISARIEFSLVSHNTVDRRAKTKPLISPLNKDDDEQKFENLDIMQDFTQDISRLTKKNQIIKAILKYVSKIQGSYIRIIIYNNPYLTSLGFSPLDLGDRTNKFAYLDAQIIESTKEGNKLFIPDIRKVQLLLLNSEKPYPISIYVYPIIEDDLLLGVLWLGFEQSYQITAEQDKFIREIIEKASPHLNLAIIGDVLNTIASEQDAILDCLQQPIIILDEENKIIYLNKFIIELESEFQNKLGFSLQELNLNLSFKKLFSDETIKNVLGGECFQKDSRIYQVLGFHKEITKNRFMKIFIFHENTSEIRLKDSFSNNITLLTHSMHAPLTSMKGYTNMLAMMGQVNDQQKEYIRKIISSVDEISNMVKNLLDIEKIENGVNLQFQNIDCVTIINKVIQSLKTYSFQKQIEIQFDCKGRQEIMVLADPFLLERAFYNLLENAIRYSNRKEIVSIKIIENGDYVEIKIKDNGIGIAPIDIPHIFEKYYRVKISSSTDNTGSGLGLYLVKSIINQHNGKISVASVLGKGSEFIVELPYR